MRILIILAMLAVTIGAFYAYATTHGLQGRTRFEPGGQVMPDGSVSFPTGVHADYQMPVFSMKAVGITGVWLIAICLLIRTWIKHCRQHT